MDSEHQISQVEIYLRHGKVKKSVFPGCLETSIICGQFLIRKLFLQTTVLCNEDT